MLCISPRLHPFRYTKALDSIKNLRKDRTAELKAEKERLLSLSREKAHSDKLKERIATQKALVTAKEVEYEERKQEYDVLFESNRKFYELFTKFREMYSTVANLEQSKKNTMSHLAEVKSKYHEVPGNQLLPMTL
jgi:DNA repair protein RAD50